MGVNRLLSGAPALDANDGRKARRGVNAVVDDNLAARQCVGAID